ncbi:addiction module protein [Flexivirga lutea]
MAPQVAGVERALLALAPKERAAVVERGLLSPDDVDDVDQNEVEAAWSTEITGRVDEYTSGDAELVDLDDHFARLRAKLTARDQ